MAEIHYPSWKLLLFVSSTFTDTQQERDVLVRQILPSLRAKCRDRDIEVTFVDMRWGVRDENTLDQRTWIECSRELERCRAESNGLFFLSLQSEKYGYTPLFKEIDIEALNEKLLNCAEDHCMELAAEWYKVDENCLPTKFVLKNLSKISDNAYWSDVLPNLTRAFDGMSLGDAFQGSLISGRSVTEWEVKSALALESDLSRVFWLHRQFLGGVPSHLDPRQLYSDAFNDKKEKFEGLIEWMTHQFGSRRRDFSQVSFDSYVNKSSEWTEQLAAWEKQARECLEEAVNNIISAKDNWDNDNELGIPGSVLTEILHHCQWVQTKAIEFIESQEIVDRIMFELIMSMDCVPYDRHIVSGLVVGASGRGKTALLAKIAASIADAQSKTFSPEHLKERLRPNTA